ncbi:MAG: hypothetical protein Q8Q12_13240, partial [bacterium]|nr:hypothetical protein [bacterium]
LLFLAVRFWLVPSARLPLQQETAVSPIPGTSPKDTSPGGGIHGKASEWRLERRTLLVDGANIRGDRISPPEGRALGKKTEKLP